jgi:hypothetical protein
VVAALASVRLSCSEGWRSVSEVSTSPAFLALCCGLRTRGDRKRRPFLARFEIVGGKELKAA